MYLPAWNSSSTIWSAKSSVSGRVMFDTACTTARAKTSPRTWFLRAPTSYRNSWASTKLFMRCKANWLSKSRRRPSLLNWTYLCSNNATIMTTQKPIIALRSMRRSKIALFNSPRRSVIAALYVKKKISRTLRKARLKKRSPSYSRKRKETSKTRFYIWRAIIIKVLVLSFDSLIIEWSRLRCASTRSLLTLSSVRWRMVPRSMPSPPRSILTMSRSWASHPTRVSSKPQSTSSCSIWSRPWRIFSQLTCTPTFNSTSTVLSRTQHRASASLLTTPTDTNKSSVLLRTTSPTTLHT